MKKLIFGFVISMALISCGGASEQAPVAVDSVKVDSAIVACCDSVAVDSSAVADTTK